jgi:cobalt-zinc-cadmium efflux system membrane fusion protein
MVATGANSAPSPATIMFISPLLDKDTRFARVVAAVDNTAGKWRPGSFITADIPTDEIHAAVVVPRSALQTVNGESIVFVRTVEGFTPRKVVVGTQDARLAEIVSGLAAGERIATTNTFTLKADLGKADAAHEH